MKHLAQSCIFSCYLPNQIEDVPAVSEKPTHIILRFRKTAECTRVLLVQPTAVFLDPKHAFFLNEQGMH